MGPSDIMAKVYLWAHPVMSTIYAQWADVGFAEIFGKLSHRFYRPLRQRVRHGLPISHHSTPILCFFIQFYLATFLTISFME
jgi:hypothetical protein